MRWIALALVVVGLQGPAQAQDERPNRRSCAQATRPVAQALAERAAEHLAKVGPAQAFKDFQDSTPAASSTATSTSSCSISRAR